MSTVTSLIYQRAYQARQTANKRSIRKNPLYCKLLCTKDGELLTLADPGVYVSEDGTPFYVVGERTTDKRKTSAAYREALANGLLYEDEGGYIRLVGDDNDAELEYSRLVKPKYRDIYTHELPIYSTMTAYRTGSATLLTSYIKPTEKVRQELVDKLGREPSANQLADALCKVRSFSSSLQHGRGYEVTVAQLLYNAGFTPFLDSAEDVSQYPKDKQKELKKQDQADVSVEGKLLEVKSFITLYDHHKVRIEGEWYIFMCSKYRQDHQLTERDYYVLIYQDHHTNIKLHKNLGGYVSKEQPVVVPCKKAKKAYRWWTDPRRNEELGVFVRVADLLCWRDFVKELKQYSHEMRRLHKGKKLTDEEMLRCYYPQADDAEMTRRKKQLDRERKVSTKDWLDF